MRVACWKKSRINAGSRFRAELECSQQLFRSAPMTPAQFSNLKEASSAIRVAIVRGPETDVLANSLEGLLAEAKGFTFSRIECHSEFGLKLDADFGDADVVVATLGTFEPTSTRRFLASVERAFPSRSVLITTTHPDAFDVFPVLEMGASDFLLAPLRRSELLPRLMRQDYADFARTFAGIGKASAARLSDGRRQLVHVTIAGANDIPIDKTSDLYRNLRKALRDFGDPCLPIRVELRELLALIISANVSVLPDYKWASVEPKIRTTLLDVFGFQRRELGQTVFLSEVISAIQQVDGVAYADVDLLSSISEAELSSPDLQKKLEQLAATTTPESYLLVHLAETVAQAGTSRVADTAVNGIFPAQLAFLTPDVPDTLILKEVPQ
jgi:hypothetical protein